MHLLTKVRGYAKKFEDFELKYIALALVELEDGSRKREHEGVFEDGDNCSKHTQVEGAIPTVCVKLSRPRWILWAWWMKHCMTLRVWRHEITTNTGRAGV